VLLAIVAPFFEQLERESDAEHVRDPVADTACSLTETSALIVLMIHELLHCGCDADGDDSTR